MKKEESSPSLRKVRRARTPSAREDQLIALAMDQAEKDLREGKASPSVVCHFLKMGSTKEKLEKEILAEQKDLIKAKTENLKAAQRMEELYTEAIKAMREYNGHEDNDD